MAELAAITFDYWNTLVTQDVEAGRGLRKSLLLEALGERGCTVEPELIDAAFEVIAERFHTAWTSGRQYVLADGVLALREILGVDPEHDSAISAAWYRSGELLDLQLVEPDLASTLEALSAEGVALGIICDVGMMPSPVLLAHLDRHDVRRFFHYWSFSDEVGFYKPAPEMFAHSHAGLGVDDPATTLHIGDLLRTDVAGARDFGAISARYAGVVDDRNDDLPEADHVVTSHTQLLELV